MEPDARRSGPGMMIRLLVYVPVYAREMQRRSAWQTRRIEPDQHTRPGARTRPPRHRTPAEKRTDGLLRRHENELGTIVARRQGHG